MAPYTLRRRLLASIEPQRVLVVVTAQVKGFTCLEQLEGLGYVVDGLHPVIPPGHHIGQRVVLCLLGRMRLLLLEVVLLSCTYCFSSMLPLRLCSLLKLLNCTLSTSCGSERAWQGYSQRGWASTRDTACSADLCKQEKSLYRLINPLKSKYQSSPLPFHQTNADRIPRNCRSRNSTGRA